MSFCPECVPISTHMTVIISFNNFRCHNLRPSSRHYATTIQPTGTISTTSWAFILPMGFLSFISNFTNITLQGMNFSSHISPNQNPLNNSTAHASLLFASALRRCCCLSTPVSICRDVKVRSKCSLTIQIAKERFVHCKSERLVSSVTSGQIFWFLAKADVRSFRLPDFPPVCNTSGDIVYETHENSQVFAFRYAANTQLSNFPACIPANHYFTPLISTKMVPQAIRSLDVPKHPIRTVFDESTYKMCHWISISLTLSFLPLILSSCLFDPLETCISCLYSKVRLPL